ncbi:hypothetical protein STEG23_007707 [Scotinomys teguina]
MKTWPHNFFNDTRNTSKKPGPESSQLEAQNEKFLEGSKTLPEDLSGLEQVILSVCDYPKPRSLHFFPVSISVSASVPFQWSCYHSPFIKRTKLEPRAFQTLCHIQFHSDFSPQNHSSNILSSEAFSMVPQ